MENKYYIVTVTTKLAVAEGRIKKVSRKYLVNAVNLTDLEVKITKEFEGTTFEYEIKNTSDAGIEKIIM